MDNTILNIKLKNDSRIIPELARFISDSAYKLGLSKKKTYYLCFVLETVLELRTKDISEANPEIELKVVDNGNYFKFSVIDFGSPYILTDNQKAILKRKLVDRFFFEQNGRNGQCFSFLYYYENKCNTDIQIEDKEELLDEEYTYHLMNNTDEDILEVIKCLYAVYGYEYYHQNLYSVESFKKYLSSGRYTPIVCENAHKQVLSYCALDEAEWFLGVPELSNLITKPLARGKGLASTMFKEAEKIAAKLDYEGIYTSAVAYHPYTQKMANKFAYVPTAIEYSINPKGTGGSTEDRRLDCVIGTKIFNKDKKHDLYIKAECNDMFDSIYKQLALNYEIHNEIKQNNNEESILTYIVDTDTSNCFMKLDVCGKNIAEELKDIINNNEINSLDVITVNLNMNDPNAIDGYEELRQLGFICTGCIPGTKNGDYMLLQSFKVQPEFDKIVLEENYKELAAKIIFNK